MRQTAFVISGAAILFARLLQAMTVVGSLLPAVLVLILSFSDESILYFPPQNWGLSLYRMVVSSPVWLSTLVVSFKVGSCAAALALVVASPAAYAIARREGLLSRCCEYLSLGPMVIPLTSYSVGLYFVFVKLHLIGTMFGLVLAHAVLALPVTIIALLTMLRRIPKNYELVAMSLGASRTRAIAGITARLLLPAFGAAFIFAFLTSFDDAVLVSFLGGTGVTTLSKAIFDSMQFSLDPSIAAISALLMTATGLLITAASLLRRPLQ
ncbi:ABC transporter permease [Bradyrhizobium erythrophlei]|uniref:Putative spermidine/putrescine transport system permease protein n=1 Tax=Bradyrhizobium erythrophlei TaxID=1437360 RepID=A0A1H4WXP7_9BRAD|nr:ABC transporter permease subunit [Bradyrhizobium erythrophlei]SEC97830.1 putative spermidine/putrescine transport system permease protein [Bradyrhizobium erythrophlei]